MLVDSDLLSAKVFVSQMKDRQIRAKNDLHWRRCNWRERWECRSTHQRNLLQLWPSQGCLLKALRNGFTLLLSNGLGFAQRNCRKQRWARREGGKSGIRAKDRAVRKRRARRADAWWPFGTNWTAGARLDFNLFAGGAQKARVAEATANANKAKHNVEWFRSGCRWKCARRTSTAMPQHRERRRRAMQRNKLKRAYGLYRTGMRQA